MKRSIRFTKTLGSRIFNDYYAIKGEPGYIDDKDNITANGTFVFVYTDKNPDRVFLAYFDEFEYVYDLPNDPTFTATITYPTITDEMVETCAKAMERRRISKPDWSDEGFNVWWEGSVMFTDRKLLLDSVRSGLEAVLQSPYIVSVS